MTQVEINSPRRVFNSLDELKDSLEKFANGDRPATSRFLTETANTLKETTRQAKESLAENTGKVANTVATTANKAVDTATVSAQQARDSLTATTHKAVDALTTVTSDSVKTITATAQQAKGSLEETLQTTEQLKNTTSDAIQTAINSSVNDWLARHPIVLRMVQALIWATNHPILSLVILLIAVALTWSLIKAVSRLLEIAGLSLLKAPFMLGVALTGAGFQTLRKFGGLAIKQLSGAKNPELPALEHSSYEKDKQQRLAEISTRLEAISQEQNELLQEAAAILAAEETSNSSMDTASHSLS